MVTVRGRLFVAVLLAALLSVVFSVPASASEDETSAGFETVLRGTNDYRELNGVDRLVHDPRMSAVAQAWAERMSADYASTRDFDAAFRHNPLMTLQVPAGWESVGENIALNGGHLDPYAYLLTQWRNSPGHNANMLNSRWTHIGIGTYQDALGITWGVQVFGDYGSPASIPNPGDAVIDIDGISYAGTVACVALVKEPSGSEFFRQCGTRAGNVYTFSDVPPGTYSTTLLAAGGGVLYSGWPTGGGAFVVSEKLPLTVPSRVTGAVVASNATGTSIDVSWSAPSDGGSPILEYLVRRSTDGGATWLPGYTSVTGNPAATSATVTGLTAGTSHVFQVAVRNGVGWAGVWSASSGSLATVGVTVPSRVTGAVVASNATGTSIDVSWSAPSDGGSPILEYVVRRSTDGGATWLPGYASVTGNPAGTSVTVQGLTPGTSYVFQVAVRNGVGWAGIWSTSSAQASTVP